jgi:hypothetical protein
MALQAFLLRTVILADHPFAVTIKRRGSWIKDKVVVNGVDNNSDSV